MRLWVHSADPEQESALTKTWAEVVQNRDGYKQAEEQLQEAHSQMEDEEENVFEEINSGVTIPSSTNLEPLLSTGVRVAEIFRGGGGNNSLVVEFRESPEDLFAFKFIKGEKHQVGTCEWCGDRNILKTACVCKKVRYCGPHCLEKDKSFHLPKCSAQFDEALRNG